MFQLLERKGANEHNKVRATERSKLEALQSRRVDANDIDPSGHVRSSDLIGPEKSLCWVLIFRSLIGSVFTLSLSMKRTLREAAL